jgi:antirestriction protein ArdC
VDGVPAALHAVERHHWDPDARAEDLLQMSGATIRHGGSRAFYRPANDEIQLLPPRAFPDAGRY